MNSRRLDEGEESVRATAGLLFAVALCGESDPPFAPSPGGIPSVEGFVIRRGQAELFQVVRALHAARGFPRRLYGWKQQPHQHADNGDRRQQLDERKG